MNAYTNDRGAPASRAIPGARSGFLWLGLAVLAAVPFFWPGLVHLWYAWQAPEYTHGPLIPIISGYLFLRQLKGVPPRPGEDVNRWPGAILLAVALLLGLAGNIIHIDGVVALVLILWVGGLILTSFGAPRGWQFWPPVLHLAFMLPLPYFIQWQTTIVLQEISSELGVALIRGMGVPVFLEGNVIDLGAWKLHVAEACSGLRYLFPIMSFTYLFAVLYQGSVWHKAVLLLAAIPIAVGMNAVRVGVIGIIVDSYGIEHAEGFMHLFEGWAVFITCILLMLGLARRDAAVLGRPAQPGRGAGSGFLGPRDPACPDRRHPPLVAVFGAQPDVRVVGGRGRGTGREPGRAHRARPVPVVPAHAGQLGGADERRSQPRHRRRAGCGRLPVDELRQPRPGGAMPTCSSPGTATSRRAASIRPRSASRPAAGRCRRSGPVRLPWTA